LLAVLAVVGVGDAIDLSSKLNLPAWGTNVGGLLMLGVVILSFVFFGVLKKDKKSN
jgi:hypothetical protein